MSSFSLLLSASYDSDDHPYEQFIDSIFNKLNDR